MPINQYNSQEKPAYKDFEAVMKNLWWEKELNTDGNIENDDLYTQVMEDWENKGYAKEGAVNPLSHDFLILVDELAQDQYQEFVEKMQLNILYLYNLWIDRYYRYK
jgi:hypothetical protein